MESESFDRALRAFARRTPFKPFVLELVSGSRFQVDHPEALVVVRGGLAVFVNADGELMVFDHEGVASLDEVKTRAGATGS